MKQEKHPNLFAGNSRMKDELHYNWKGDSAQVTAKHNWVAVRKTKTGVCSVCGRTPKPFKNSKFGTDWANIDHQYRRVLDDYVEMCRPCHRIHDRELRVTPT
jgi:hypothetical protein